MHSFGLPKIESAIGDQLEVVQGLHNAACTSSGSLQACGHQTSRMQSNDCAELVPLHRKQRHKATAGPRG